MAIVIGNQSKCFICGKILSDKENIEMFPPFVANMNDPLFIFSDTGVHTACLNKHPLKEEAIKYRNEFVFNNLPENRICGISGKIITDPHNFISVGVLTSNKKEELYKYNFLKIDRDNLRDWSDRDHFLSVATKYLIDGKWKSYGEFNVLEYLVDVIKS